MLVEKKHSLSSSDASANMQNQTQGKIDNIVSQQYSLQLTGKLLENKSRSEVKKGISEIFKLNQDSTDKLFQNLPAVVKKKLDRDAAYKFKNDFKKAGAECIIVQNDKVVPGVIKEASERKASFTNKRAKIPCIKCKTMILSSTAERTDGFCMTCYKNTSDYSTTSAKKVKKTAKDTPKEMVSGSIAAIASFLGIVAGIVMLITCYHFQKCGKMLE